MNLLLIFTSILVHQSLAAPPDSNNCNSAEDRICSENFGISMYKKCFLGENGRFNISEEDYVCPLGSECVKSGPQACRSVERLRIEPELKLSERAAFSNLVPLTNVENGIRFYVAWYRNTSNPDNPILFPPIQDSSSSKTDEPPTSTTSASTSSTSKSSTAATSKIAAPTKRPTIAP